VLYPWPFAGYSRDGDDGVFWDEIMIVGKVDVSGSGEEGRKMAKFFGVKAYPSIVFIRRGGKIIHQKDPPEQFRDSDDFTASIWKRFVGGIL
jgi:hypothetical protein